MVRRMWVLVAVWTAVLAGGAIAEADACLRQYH